MKHLQLVLSYTTIDEAGHDSHGLSSTRPRTSQSLMIAHDTSLLPEVPEAQNGKRSLDPSATHSTLAKSGRKHMKWWVERENPHRGLEKDK